MAVVAKLFALQLQMPPYSHFAISAWYAGKSRRL
jgi:hypothetical protein